MYLVNNMPQVLVIIKNITSKKNVIASDSSPTSSIIPVSNAWICTTAVHRRLFVPLAISWIISILKQTQSEHLLMWVR